MSAFSFHLPTNVVFGQPVHQALPEALTELRARRVLVVSDSGLVAVGLTGRVASGLREQGWEVSIFSEVQSNPTTFDAETGLTVAQTEEAEALVALGGGSVIDVAKAIGLLATNGGSWADYQWHSKPVSLPILPLIAVPTTAGTGSEVTRVAVIADAVTQFKKGVVSPHLCPRFAVVDPALTLSLPARLTAATGADVLVHALEAFIGRRANPISDTLALAALERAWRALPVATHDGQDWQARSEMALASTLAGIAFDASGLGIIHALAGPLATHHDLHHGLSIGLLLAHGLAFNLPYLGAKRAPLLDALGIPASAADGKVFQRVQAWVRGLGLPQSLQELGIQEPDLEALAGEASQMVLLPNNPRPATEEDCRQILEGLV